MRTALVMMLALALGLGVAGVTLAHMSQKMPEGLSGGMTHSGRGMMGGGQMDEMMPMMHACVQMMQQMSATMGQHATSQQYPSQPENK